MSKDDAQSLSLASKMNDGSFVMRADAENRSVGRGRNSVRISSKAKFADVSCPLALAICCLEPMRAELCADRFRVYTFST